jgi:hypothetical protein
MMMMKNKVLMAALVVTLCAANVKTVRAQSDSTRVKTETFQVTTTTRVQIDTVGEANLKSAQNGEIDAKTTGNGSSLRFGVQGGYFVDQKNPYLGVHFKHGLFSNFLLSAPNVEYAMRDNGTFFTVNADLHYVLPSRSSMNFWFGAGLGVARLSLEDRGNDTSFGVNLVSGVNLKGVGVVPFLRLKAMLFETSEIAIGGGVTF